ncbi:anaerobic ribonucleoside-triphosphate reductase [Bacilli bacterium PM5-3]|nr:anaerobic ribonucleoside-triphosphate reductase [Bacilli bacterium PM5-3]MDH6604013.1 anaerobic ribonucleoside-triphosphate reductase [Bacilli bacterium PM5-9]
MKPIKKRDGRIAPFDPNKIINAIEKAKIEAQENFEPLDIYNRVYAKMQFLDNWDVEKIQDLIEEELISSNLANTAKKFIIYRNKRSEIREKNTKLMQILNELTFSDAADSDLKRENANIDGDTPMATMLRYGSEASKTFYKQQLINPEHASLHDEGLIHIHDMDFYSLTTTCTQIDLLKLFKGGFSTGHGHLREPNDISSYASLACIAIQSNQNDQHGGQSIPTFDYAMAPGIKKTFKKLYHNNYIKYLSITNPSIIEDYEKFAKENTEEVSLSNFDKYKEVEYNIFGNKDAQDFAYKEAYNETNRKTYQAMEGFLHNLNTMHSRAGAQVPFSSINYGTDTSIEGRMLMKNLLEATEAGLGNGETFIFPIQIFKVKEGINYNENDPNHDLFELAIRCSAKRLFPNFSFIDATFNKQYYKENDPNTEIAYMGCRTRVISNTYDPSNEVVTGRGNLSFTSLNLVRLALISEDTDDFFKKLDYYSDLICDQLYDRYEIVKQKTKKNFPFLMGQGVWLDSEKLTRDETVEEVLKHGTLSVGYIGLAECLIILTGKHHGESEDAQKLGLEIIGKLREKTDNKAKETGLNYSLIATPAEGLSGRFTKIDRQKFGTIDRVTDKSYYTNSFHVPVYYPIKIYDKLKIEAPYHELSNAGHISYVEVDGNPSNNLESFKEIIKAMKELNIGYGSVNHPVDRDPVCGYVGIINDECPKCHRSEDNQKFERIRRITGYLVGTLDQFNEAKKEEESQRVKHGR